MIEASAPETQPGLTQIQRVVNIFIAPSKTFQDVKRSASWWLPYLIAVAITAAAAVITLHNFGIDRFTNSVITHSPRLADQLANNPEAADHVRSMIASRIKLGMYASPVLDLLNGLIVAALFLGTANFIFGGEATFGQMLAVYFYSTLPVRLSSILGLFFSALHPSPDIFSRGPIGSSIAYYLHPGAVAAPLLPLLAAIDIFVIWKLILMTLGVSTVANLKRGMAAAVVFGWWGFGILFRMAGAALRHHQVVK